MITESLFTFLCAGLIGMLFGTALAFAGYKLFVFLLPVWGFFFGLALGAQTIQVLFQGTGLFQSVTSWVVGFIVGALFAVLSYAFYLFAVAVIGGSLGYVVVAALWLAIFNSFNFVGWLVALLAGIGMAFVTIRFNLQKWVVIITTSIMGVALVFATIIMMFNPVALLLENPVKAYLSTSPFMTIVALVTVVCAIVFQVKATGKWEVEAYNRLSE